MGSYDGGERVQQRRDALARANRLRSARAGLKRQIAMGEISCADLLLRPSREIEGMSVAALLESQRYWGERRCRRLLVSLQISEGKAVGAMTERQRLAIAAALTGAGAVRPGRPETIRVLFSGAAASAGVERATSSLD